MITIRLKGGLGNQMFQYAAGRAMSLKKNTKLCLDVSYFDFKLPGVTKRVFSLGVFNIEADIIKTSFLSYIISRLFGSNNYYQSKKYFEGYEDIVRKDFTLKEPLGNKSAELLDEIRNCESVAIHVRRGDYVGNKLHPVMEESYYKRAIEYISGKTKIDKLYIFSDDIRWCKENLKFDHQTIFVGDEYSGKEGVGHMVLMSGCRNFIISNSTFSWWAAWLARNPAKIIVAPKNWFSDGLVGTNDIIPSEWIII